MATVNGSPEHFQQVVSAHVVSMWGTCRCGASVGAGPAAYRAHIESVWRPHTLPAGWMVANGASGTAPTLQSGINAAARAIRKAADHVEADTPEAAQQIVEAYVPDDDEDEEES